MMFRIVACSFGLVLLFTPHVAFAENGTGSPANWDGTYAGLTLGVARNTADPTSATKNNGYFVTTDPGQVNPQGGQNIETTDLNGSLLMGLNRQSGNLVYGVEADVSYVNFDDSYASGGITYLTVPTRAFNVTTNVKSDWIVSLRPRLGYAENESLYFVSAGPALTRLEYDFTFADTNGPEFSRITSNKTKLGWSASMGYEHKMSGGWALKGEYVYSHFADAAKGSSNLQTVPADGFDNDVTFHVHNLRFGLVKSF